MDIAINTNIAKGSLINVGDATFYIYENKSSTVIAETTSFTDFHIHAGFEVFYLQYGDFSLQTEKGEIKIKEGDVVIIPPHHYHQTAYSSGEFLRHCFSFQVFPNRESNEDSEYLFYNRILSGINEITILNDEIFESTMNRIIELEEGESLGKKYIIYSLLTVFLMDVFSKLRIVESSLVKKKKNEPKKFNSFNERQKYIIENCLADHFADENPSAIIEELLKTSKRNAARVVYNLFGENISDLILKYRMKIAKMYVENTDLPFNKLSEKLGYKTYVAFFTAFKKYYGLSPNHYKEKYGKTITGNPKAE